MSAVQPSHVLWKTPVTIDVGLQLVNTSAEKSVSDEQLKNEKARCRIFGKLVENDVKGLF